MTSRVSTRTWRSADPSGRATNGVGRARLAAPEDGIGADPQMLVLAHSDLVGLLPPFELVAAVEQAACDLHSGRAIVPKRSHLDWAGNPLLTMPAVSGGGFGVKMVAVVPGNASRGLPVTSGLMILNDGETGAPLAIMDAGSLTAQRTGAVGGVGVKFMTPIDMSSMGIVGCGVQGAWQVIVACALRPIREVFCV